MYVTKQQVEEMITTARATADGFRAADPSAGLEAAILAESAFLLRNLYQDGSAKKHMTVGFVPVEAARQAVRNIVAALVAPAQAPAASAAPVSEPTPVQPEPPKA